MAVSNEDLARLVVTLEVTTTKAINALKKAQNQTNTTASAIEKRLTTMSSRIDRTFANMGSRMSANLLGPLAGIGAAFSTREIIRYADTWTEAGNRIRAAGEIVGMQGRPLDQIRQLADETRAGFNETVQLYARLLRSAGDVATSELEIAKATEIVNKAFKAGGAATSEMNAGILQLSQGLSSGFLQGDELRSVRENAPVLAQVIADYFKTTIGGLKELGSEGKLVSSEIFKAILSGQQKIETAFAATNRTIGDSFRLVENALIQYIGTADKSLGATAMITQALTALADNFDTAADVALKFAAIIAGAILGRSLVKMVGFLGNAASTLTTLAVAMHSASLAGKSMGAAFAAAIGPLSILLGGAAALAFQHFASESAKAAANVEWVSEEAERLGFHAGKTAKEIREAARSTAQLTEETKKLAEAERQRELVRTRQAGNDLRYGTFADNAGSIITSNSDLKSAAMIAQRAFSETFKQMGSEVDVLVNSKLKELAEGLKDSTIPAQDVISKLRELQQLPISQSTLDLLDALDKVALQLTEQEFKLDVIVDTTEVDEAREKFQNFIVALSDPLASFPLTDDLKRELKKITDGFDGTKESAEDVVEQILDLADLDSSLRPFISQILSLANAFGLAADKAYELKDAANIVNNKQYLDNLERQANTYVGDLTKKAEESKAYSAFMSEQKRLLAMNKEELAIEEEIVKVRKEATKAGTRLSAEEERRLAQNRIKQRESIKQEGKKENKTDKDRLFENVEEQRLANQALEAEIALRKELNPLTSDYETRLEALRLEQEWLNEAKLKGIELGPTEIDLIKQTALATAEINEENRKLAESQEKLIESTQEWLDLAKSSLRSIIDDLMEGKSAADAFGNALNQVGSFLIDLGLNTLFGKVGGDSGLASLFTKREFGGPVRAGHPYIVGEKRPELFVPNQNGVIVPRVPNQLNTSSEPSVHIPIQIDATGADAAGLARLQGELVKLRSEIPSLIKSTTQKRSKKGW